MSDPRINLLDSTRADDENQELVSWIDRFKKSLNTIIRQIRQWISEHTLLTPPLYLNDPHPQYWHKVLDPAWAHMYFQSFSSPRSLNEGDVFTNFDGSAIADWQLTSDLAAGTIVVDDSGEHSEYGTFQLSLTGYLQGSNNAQIVLTLYSNGAPTAIRMPVQIPGNSVYSSIAWSGVVHIDFTTTLDVRLEQDTGSGVDIIALNWSMHRISSLAGTIGVDTTSNPGFWNAPPLPDQGPGPP